MILIWNDAPSAFADSSSPCPGGLQLGPPKSRAGVRTVSFPAAPYPNSSTTWTRILSTALTGWCLSTSTGMASRKLQSRSPLAAGPRADRVPKLHLHDQRHTGNTLAAQSGASLRDLMTRMGHDSPHRCPDLSTQQQDGRRSDRGSPRRPAERAQITPRRDVVGPLEGPTEPQLIDVEPDVRGKMGL
jgi:hypothetical protein